MGIYFEQRLGCGCRSPGGTRQRDQNTTHLSTAASHEQVEAHKKVAVITGNKTRVLVIDDDPIVADTLAMVLNVSGFEATAVYSGETALELARLKPFDKLVTDVMMEPMTGIQAALALSHIHPKCQILLMSGNERTAKVLQEAADEGHTFEILAKPVHPSVIIDLLRAEPPTASACPSGLPNEKPSTQPTSIKS
jgi:CheY-like chemotaxis protein